MAVYRSHREIREELLAHAASRPKANEYTMLDMYLDDYAEHERIRSELMKELQAATKRQFRK